MSKHLLRFLLRLINNVKKTNVSFAQLEWLLFSPGFDHDFLFLSSARHSLRAVLFSQSIARSIA